MVSSSGGPTVQLQATGAANAALNGPANDPNTNTCFRRSFRKNTHFATETLAADSLSINSGGSTATQEIPRVGDVVYAAYLSVAVPGIANVALLDTSGTADMAQVSSAFYAEVMPSTAQLLRYKASASDGSGHAVLDGAALNGTGGTHTSPFFPYWLSPRWVPAIAMISSIKLIVGTNEIDELTTPILCIWKELAGSGNGDFSYVEGDWDYALDAINASKSMQMYYIDLPFAFFLAPPGNKASNSLSLITLSFHTVQISVTPRILSQCIIGYAVPGNTTPFRQNNAADDANVSEGVTTVVRPGQSVASAASASTGLSNGTLSHFNATQTGDVTPVQFSDINWQLLYAFAYLENEERAMYSDVSYETIITCWDYTVQNATNTSTSQNLRLSFSHPTAAIFMLAQSKHRRLASASQGGAVVEANETQYRNDWLDFSGITEYVTLQKWPPFLGCSIELNSLRLNGGGFGSVGNNLLHEQYYRKLMLMQNANKSPYRAWSDYKEGRPFIYVFSFSLMPLGPDPLQPNGFINLARVDDVKIKFLLDDQLFVDNSARQNENLSNNTVDVHVIALTYNIFRYVLGLGGRSLV